MTVERSLTPTDTRLLARLATDPNVVRAAHAVGISRDRAVYRLGRLERLYGRPVVRSRRGGMDRGGSRLTALGLRLLRAAEGGRPGANHWTGTFETGPPPSVRLDGSASLEVSFHARDHERVTVEVEPEAFVLALRPVELSARNRLAATVEEVRPHADGTAMVTTRWRGRRVRVVVTIASVKRMRLAPGRRLYCYLKATAVRRVREASLGPRGLASTRRARR